MKRTRFMTVGTLAMSLGLTCCDDSSPMGVPDEMETEETLDRGAEEMVEEARTEADPPQNIQKDYRPDQREEELSGQAKDFAKEATAETRPSDE